MEPKDFSEKLKQQKAKYEKELIETVNQLSEIIDKKEESFNKIQRSNASNKRWKEYYKKELETTKIELKQKESVIKGYEIEISNTSNFAVSKFQELIDYKKKLSQYAHYLALTATLATMSLLLSFAIWKFYS